MTINHILNSLNNIQKDTKIQALWDTETDHL
jgi:hypothetical protein